jgi:pimeloyl-ACP methyl ester carboxylesterase
MWGGYGPPLLLLHGFGDNALVWHHFASALDGSCCSLAIDLRGHGHSEWDSKGTYALSDFVADIVDVLEDLCPTQVVLVGHSLGAQIAIRAAAQCREHIRAVVLVDFAVRPNELSAGYVRRKFRERQRVYDSVEHYVALLHEQLPLVHEPLPNVLAEGALRMNEDGYFEERCDPILVNREDVIDTPAILAALKQIARPILFVRGAGSAVLSHATARELIAKLPQSRMGAVARAGHTVMLDNPEGFCTVVKEYVLKFSSGPLGKAAATSPPYSEGGVALHASSQRDTP